MDKSLIERQGRISIAKCLRRLSCAFARDERGAAAIYVGIIMVALIGVGMISVDVGQMVVLRNEMQNAADSACLAAAAQIDGTSGAQTRATAVAQNVALDESGLASGSSTLTIDQVLFYRTWNDADLGTVLATVDADTNFVRVELAAKDLDFLLAPAFNALIGGGSGDSVTLDTYAVCQYASMDCSTVPFMMCSPVDPTAADWGDSYLNPLNFGRQTVSKEGPGSGIPTANGNFGLLCPGGGSCGASAVAAALASDDGGICQGSSLTTKPGSATNQVIWGINVRFGGTKYTGSAAPNTAPYPRDDDYLPGGPGVTPIFGDTLAAPSWDVKAYWNTEHQRTNSGDLVYEWDAVAGVCDTTKPVGQPHFVYSSTDNFVTGLNFAADTGTIKICTTAGGEMVGSDIDPAAVGLPTGPSDTSFYAINAETIADAAASLSPVVNDTIDEGTTKISGDYLDANTSLTDPDSTLTRYKLYLFETYYNQSGSCGAFSPAAYTQNASCLSTLLAHERRVVRIVVVDCEFWGVSGKTELDMELRFVDVFLTEEADPPNDATIYAEILRDPVGDATNNYGGADDEVLNVRLVE
jgi:Flp pilus assembly protein TadG